MMVKICGITNIEDALAAIEGGASALGFNFWPRSPRYITPESARRLIQRLPSGILKAGVFVDEDRALVAQTARSVALDIVQLHGQETPSDFPDGTRVWKAVRIRETFDPSAVDVGPAEALLLDGPANGVPFDWSIATRVSTKVIIAGGLDADNVRRAMEQARPWGVDACSRIEISPGKKDHVRMAQFLKAALSS
ncbi:MAG: phosphoribosylanthranilate isomerase [Bryobacterales bacterium]|nr:phosphoribosylanthranilate isomerase [Bryobacterales bacterium]